MCVFRARELSLPGRSSLFCARASESLGGGGERERGGAALHRVFEKANTLSGLLILKDALWYTSDGLKGPAKVTMENVFSTLCDVCLFWSSSSFLPLLSRV